MCSKLQQNTNLQRVGRLLKSRSVRSVYGDTTNTLTLKTSLYRSLQASRARRVVLLPRAQLFLLSLTALKAGMTSELPLRFRSCFHPDSDLLSSPLSHSQQMLTSSDPFKTRGLCVRIHQSIANGYRERRQWTKKKKMLSPSEICISIAVEWTKSAGHVHAGKRLGRAEPSFHGA